MVTDYFVLLDHSQTPLLCCRPKIRQVIFAIFAGYDTTAVSLTRMLQLLGSADGKTVVGQLLQELNKPVTVGDKQPVDSAGTPAGNAAKGIFAAFPLLNAVALETSR